MNKTLMIRWSFLVLISAALTLALAGGVHARPFTAGQTPLGTGNCNRTGPDPSQRSVCLNASDVNNARETSISYPPSTNDYFHGVPTNAALKALSPVTGATVRRLGFYVAGDGGAADYTLSSSPCSLNSGLGDNGAQVQAQGGGCWNISAASESLSPLIWGAVGDGTTNDTAAVQAAIDGASCTLGVPLIFDARHLYNITSSLTMNCPGSLVGPYRYGIWAVNQPTGSGPETCTWGLVTKNTGITMINAAAVTGTIRGLCIDMTGNQNTNPSSGAAIQIKPPTIATYSSGWHVEQSTILNPYDGITIPGNGGGAQCCGIGTSADGDAILRNTIVSPADAAIAIGKNSAAAAGGPGTVGITVTDNDIVCKTTTSRANAYGVVIYEGAIWYDGTENGPEGCHIGTAVIPGRVGGHSQSVELNADGVFGDQSGAYNLLIQPTTGGQVNVVTIGGKGPWANSTTNVPNVLIDGTHAATMQQIIINGLFAGGGNGNTGPVVDIEGGANGPYNVLINNSIICQQGVAGSGAIALKLNAGAGSTGRWVVSGNSLGTGCIGGVGTNVTGVSLTINPDSTSNGSITIANNDISNATTPISYTPNSGGRDKVIINNNLGVDTIAANLTAAATVSLSNATPNYFVRGSTTINTINGAWQGRRVRFVAAAAGTLNLGTSGNICAGAISGGNTVDLAWMPGGACWSHVP